MPSLSVFLTLEQHQHPGRVAVNAAEIESMERDEGENMCTVITMRSGRQHCVTALPDEILRVLSGLATQSRLVS